MDPNTTNPIDLIIQEAQEKAAKKKERESIKNGDKISAQIVSEDNRFFTISMVLLVIGCLGGVAVGLGAGGNLIQTSLLIIPVMATLSLLLAVQPMKYIIASASIAVLVDIIIIANNLL